MDPAGTCTYCLREVAELTEDHVFPDSWYTADTPAAVQRPMAPACPDCNHVRYSRIEERLRGMIVLCYPEGDDRVEGVQAPAKRAFDPDSTEDERERRIRSARRRRLYAELRQLWAGPIPSGAGFLAGFGADEPGADATSPVPISGDDFHDFAEKLARGMTYVQTGRLIGPEYVIETWAASDLNAESILGMMIDPVTTRFGPAFECVVSRAVEDPIAGVFIFTIWGRLRIAGTVQPKDSPTTE